MAIDNQNVILNAFETPAAIVNISTSDFKFSSFNLEFEKIIKAKSGHEQSFNSLFSESKNFVSIITEFLEKQDTNQIRVFKKLNINAKVYNVKLSYLGFNQILIVFEEQLNLSNNNVAYLSSIARAIDGVLWKGVEINGSFTLEYMSPKSENVIGYSCELWLRNDEFWNDHIYPDDQERTITFCQNEMKKGNNHTIEYRMVHADGHPVWLKEIVTAEVINEEVHFTGVIIDISVSKKEELRLKFLESIIVNMKECVLILDNESEKVKITYCNDSFLQETGYQLEEIIGKDPNVLFGSKTSEKTINEFIASIITSHQYENELLIYRKNGEKKWFSINLSPIINPDGRRNSIVVASNITLKKQESEKKLYFEKIRSIFRQNDNLKASLNDLSTLFARSNDFLSVDFWCVSVDKKRLNRVSTYAKSPAINSIIESSSASVLIGEGLPGKILQSQSIEFIDNCKNQHVHHQHINSIFGIPVFSNSDAIGVILVYKEECFDKNITEFSRYPELPEFIGNEVTRKQLEQELSLVINFAPDTIAILDEDLNFVKINNAFSLFTGLSEIDIVNHNLFDLIHPEDLEHYKNSFQFEVNDLEAHTFDVRYKIKGNIEWLSWTFTKFKESRIYLCIAKNVSKTKQIECKLRNVNKELEQFAYIASHDLQEPLRMISSFLALLEKKYENQLDEKAKQYIFYAVDGAKRMRKIIIDLLEFSRIGNGENQEENFNPIEIFDEIKILYSQKIKERNASLSCENIQPINTNKTLFRQLFSNLISNSLKYSKNDTDTIIKITQKSDVAQHVFEIKDNGIGIDKKDFERVFQLFNRLHTKDEYSGTGLGLAICKKITDTLNGTIEIQSEKGIGSTFIITIPK